MFRRFSALVLLVFLTFLVGAKDLAVGYCLCEEAFFLGHLPCSDSAASLSSSDCECHECAQPSAPSEDCFVTLQLEVEDYLWSPTQQGEAPNDSSETTWDSLNEWVRSSPPLFLALASGKALEPPPPTVSLFRRHGELLL